MLPFVKMHGLGNDFVVIDGRERQIALAETDIRAIADRRRGVGCDQLVLIENATKSAENTENGPIEARIRFFNADGSESGACGNGSRCVAAGLMVEKGSERLDIETESGILHAEKGENGLITIDMGPPQRDWRAIPLAEDADPLHLPVATGDLRDPVGIGMGNPHCVFFVDDAEAVDLATLGPEIEHHPLFPERSNVEVASAAGPDRFRLRVWERGAGITQACGTGACATAVAAVRKGLTSRKATVNLDGGPLHIYWR